jgi:hypothetical protein
VYEILLNEIHWLTCRPQLNNFISLKRLLQRSGQSKTPPPQPRECHIRLSTRANSFSDLELLETFSENDIWLVPLYRPKNMVRPFSAETCQALGADIYELRKIHRKAFAILSVYINSQYFL